MNAIDSYQCLRRDTRVSEHVENKRYCHLQSCVPSLALQCELPWSEIFIVYIHPGSDQTALNVHLITFKSAQPQQCIFVVLVFPNPRFCLLCDLTACSGMNAIDSCEWVFSDARVSELVENKSNCHLQSCVPSFAMQFEFPWSEIFIVYM